MRPLGALCLGLVVLAVVPACRRRDRSGSAPGRPIRAAPSSSHRSGLVFSAETIRLVVSPGRLQVDGDYGFTVEGPRPFRGPVAYPIWRSAEQLAPARVLVGEREAPTPVCREPGRCLTRFPVAVSPGAVARVRVRYEQVLTGRRAVYLVTTARRWHRPLRRAELEVRLPRGFAGVRLSYPADERREEGDQQVWRVLRRDFTPDRELEVTWTSP